ncbi:MAG: hypothetical protein R3E86_11535 [Pseudomonadales bacterium]
MEDRAGALFHLIDHQFEVGPTGRGKFPFVLVDNWFQLQVASSSAKSLPLVYVQVSSEVLSRSGMDSALSRLFAIAKFLDPGSGDHGVSRVDLCVDFVSDHAIGEIQDRAWVTRAKGIDRYTQDRRFSGYTIGRGGELSCRLYDKTLEIDQKSKKVWLFQVWSDAGWDGRFPVWRLEFQFRRTVLRELGVTTAQDLTASLNSLWQYAMTQWLRLVVPTDDSNQTRWPAHPLWKELSQASFNSFPREPLSRIRKSRVPSDEYLFRNALGGVTSFMAREGLTNIELAVPVYFRKAQAYHEDLRRITGQDLNEYAKVRAKEKSRRFNKIRDPASIYSGEKYRRRKDGEPDRD